MYIVGTNVCMSQNRVSFCLVGNDLGGVQFVLDVQSLENFEKLLTYGFRLFFVITLKNFSSIKQSFG